MGKLTLGMGLTICSIIGLVNLTTYTAIAKLIKEKVSANKSGKTYFDNTANIIDSKDLVCKKVIISVTGYIYKSDGAIQDVQEIDKHNGDVRVKFKHPESKYVAMNRWVKKSEYFHYYTLKELSIMFNEGKKKK